MVSYYNKEKYSFSENTKNNDKLFLPNKDILGSTDVKTKINVFTEFGKLKSVVIGYMNNTSRYPEDTYRDDNTYMNKNIPVPEEIIKTNNINQEKIVKILQDKGIHVVRPGDFDFSEEIEIQGFKTTHSTGFNARDLILYYHDSVYETPSYQPSRQYEHQIFNWINYQLREKGSKWFKSYVGLPPYAEQFRLKQGYQGDEVIDSKIPLFDAANIIRVGLDIIFLVSLSGYENSYKMFRDFMEERYNKKVRVHRFENNCGVHIDTTFTVLGYNKKLKKNILLANEKKTNPLVIPAIFRGKNWVVIESPKLKNKPCIEGLEICSPDELGMNFFVIDSHCVVVEEREKELTSFLEYYGVEVILHPNPYGRESIGAFHCMTNDYNREEDIDYGKILEEKDSSNLTKEDLAGLFDPELLEFLQEKGDLTEWTEICNKNGIYPTYIYDHLSEKQKAETEKKHVEYIRKNQK